MQGDQKDDTATEVSPMFSDGDTHNSEKCDKQTKEVGKQEDNADTTCGFWIFKSPIWQRFANENTYVALYGLAGLIISMEFAYFNGTITTLEKRFKIPTKTTGIITIGNDVSVTLASGFLGYYAGRGHRPRWMGFGMLLIVVFCLMTASPHFIYGAGKEALELTREFGASSHAKDFLNSTQEDRTLCNANEPSCVEDGGNWIPVVLLFSAHFISGIGCALFYILGLTYMDDNTNQAKTPAMLSWSAFLRMLGPAIGYALGSLCLRVYIAPELEPVINNSDARWLGAWWLGWLLFAAITVISALTMFMFPKELPSARERRLKLEKSGKKALAGVDELSLADMMKSVKRLACNKVYVYNNVASMLYFFGYTPYWIFTPKYIETQYRQSAATASMVTGAVALAFSAAGVLLSGVVLSRYKPSARAMAAWNGFVDVLTVVGVICYMFIGCEDSDNMATLSAVSGDSCSASCHCDLVQYAPICGRDNVTYISACHAGCTGKSLDALGQSIYSGCECITSSSLVNDPEAQLALAGACPVDCFQQFITFLAVMCFMKFVGAAARTSNMLITLRSVSAEDKSFSLGLAGVVVSLITFIPAPIFFGWLLDSFCLVWGKTCTSKGNCWLYDTKSLRFTLNFTTAVFMFASCFFNIGVWYHSKNLQIFDDEEDETMQADIEHFRLTDTKQRGSIA